MLSGMINGGFIVVVVEGLAGGVGGIRGRWREDGDAALVRAGNCGVGG